MTMLFSAAAVVLQSLPLPVLYFSNTFEPSVPHSSSPPLYGHAAIKLGRGGRGRARGGGRRRRSKRLCGVSQPGWQHCGPSQQCKRDPPTPLSGSRATSGNAAMTLQGTPTTVDGGLAASGSACQAPADKVGGGEEEEEGSPLARTKRETLARWLCWLLLPRKGQRGIDGRRRRRGRGGMEEEGQGGARGQMGCAGARICVSMGVSGWT